MKNCKEIFEEGQEINTIKYTDYKDIVKIRTIKKVGYDEVKFYGLIGWWKYRVSPNRAYFHQGDKQLERIN